MTKTIAIDEEGYFLLPSGARVSDPAYGKPLLNQLKIDPYGVLTSHYEGDPLIIEAFDKPLVALQIHKKNNGLEIQMPYEVYKTIELSSLCIDEWDRFHGLTQEGIPFVLSRTAQAELFNLVDDFSDDGITLNGQSIHTPSYYLSNNQVQNEKFWTQKYQASPSPSWDLDRPHPELKSFLQQLKINKCRILVPGCGLGHDAAFLAEQGHVVTAMDFSETAIKEAQKRYGHLEHINFVVADIFNPPEIYLKSFDLIFEHTLYCAISPDQRDQLVHTYEKYLDETGHLLAIFFVVPKREGPYFGSSEWEVREKLQKRFKFYYWTRLKHSPDWRNGAELMVYAQKKN